ncbi:MAG: diguanylate cyclase [Clostridia bacterium]|nr:MAG: diguanylate cyclase [Clostridia bacterium]
MTKGAGILFQESLMAKEDLITTEKRIGLAKKWAVHIGGLLLLAALYPAWFDPTFRLLAALFIAAAAAYSGYVLYLARPGHIRLVWYFSYVECAVFTGYLIYYSGGLDSEFVLMYTVIMAGVAASRLRVIDFLATGFLGHVSYAVALYLFYGNLDFYLTPAFWVRCLLITGVFLLSLLVVEMMVSDNEKLRRAKQELEEKSEQLAASNSKLEALAVTDGLTGLYNHRYFQQRLREEIKRAERYESIFSLAMLDVDYFKCYNDAHGHPHGDGVLVEIARLIRENIRAADVAARYGGEEFAVIFVEMDCEVAVDAAERIRRAIETHDFPGSEYQPGGRLTVSIGVASYPADAQAADELIRKADEALYRAKEKHRNLVIPYHSLTEDLGRIDAAELELDESESSLMATVQAILAAIDQKDRYTYGHAERTMRYAEALARKLGFPEERIRVLRYAAFLHDIGKLKIAKEILNKSRPLTDEEKEIVRLHSLYGVNILEPLANLQRLVPIIRHHHERYDGQGYPDGLKDEDIPLEARIMAVADAYDAMRAQRPYRRALGVGEALEELERCAGTQFDPQLVERFTEVVRELEGVEREPDGTD